EQQVAVLPQHRDAGRRDRLPPVGRRFSVTAQAAEHTSVAQAGFDVVWLDLEGAPEERLGLAQLPAWRCDAERHAGRQIGGSYAALNARCGVRFTLAAAQEQHLGVRGKDFARAREVQVIVL